MASGFGTMYTRIAAELDRTDLTTFIKSAIVSAIDYFSTERFWFNERKIVFPTVVGKVEYPLVTVDSQANPIRIVEIDSLYLTNSNGWRYLLTPAHYQELDAENFNTSFQSSPVKYAIHHENLMLWPRPDQIYTVDGTVLADINQVTVDSASAATNAWFTVAEEMIRCRAKADIYENVIRNTERAGAMFGQASAKMGQLRTASEKQSVIGSITPWF